VVLEEGNRAKASVDRVKEASLGLIGERQDCIVAVLEGELLEDLAYIASTKHLVDFGELLGLVAPKVGCEYAVLGAPPLEQFAGRAR